MSSTVRKATQPQLSAGARAACNTAIAAFEPYDDEDLVDGLISKIEAARTAEKPDLDQSVNADVPRVGAVKAEKRDIRLAAVAKVEADLLREGELTPEIQAGLRKASEAAQLAALRERNPKAAEIWQQNNAGRMGR